IALAFDGYGPWTRPKILRIGRWIAFVRAEFIKSVVAGDIFERCQFLAMRAEVALLVIKLRSGMDDVRRNEARDQLARSKSCAGYAGRGYKATTIEIIALFCDV